MHGQMWFRARPRGRACHEERGCDVMRILLKGLGGGVLSVLTYVLLAAPTSVIAEASPNHAVQITLQDQGFVPGRVYAGVNKVVTLRIVNRGSKIHEFAIPYYYVFTRNLNPGDVTTVSFTPSTAGRFDMVSDPKGNDEPEFKGEFIVTDHK
jgi:plastocyanin domain-containing protein